MINNKNMLYLNKFIFWAGIYWFKALSKWNERSSGIFTSPFLFQQTSVPTYTLNSPGHQCDNIIVEKCFLNILFQDAQNTQHVPVGSASNARQSTE